MKPEISTAVMIERIRELATDSADSQDRVLFTQAANRIELLLAAESGMSREMACIRHALDIPPDQSVQSGVVDAFVRLNAEILELRNQLAELRGQAPELLLLKIDDEPNRHRRLWMEVSETLGLGKPFYTHPVPPAASQHVPGEPDYWVYDTKFGLDISREKPEHEENTEPYFPVFKADPVASQPCTVPEEVMRVLGFFASVIKSGEQWTSVCQHEYDTAIAACRAAILKSQMITDSGALSVMNHSEDVLDMVNHPVIPGGWVLVPAKANAAMISAAGRAAREYMEEYGGNSPQVIYQAMLAVAPKLDRKGGDTVSPDTSAVPDGYALVSIDLLNKFPEINICNYNHDDVGELNSWGIELVSSTDQKPISKDGDA